MNATELVNQYYEYRNKMDAINSKFNLHNMLSDAVTYPEMTPQVHAGMLIAKHGVVGALAVCVRYGLDCEYQDSDYLIQAALLVISAANIE